MATVEAVRGVIAERYQNVREISANVFKGELVHEGKPYAVAFWDLSDSIVERSENLKLFQESLVGPEFFSADGDLRWNNYLFFLAGPKSVASDDFLKAKIRIEADRHFARKFVLDGDELVQRLKASDETDHAESAPLVDAGDIWAGMLRAASLGALLLQPPRTAAVARVISGSAFKDEVATPQAKASLRSDLLGQRWLRRLSISSFRKVHTNIAFDFAGVNLIVGANGAGKTSLLEAIEGLYCGRVRRDPSTSVLGVTGYVDNGKNGLELVKATTATATLKARNAAWYRRSDFQVSGISQGFARFNFLDTDAAFRLSASDDPAEIKDDLGKLLVGPESAKLWEYLGKLYDDLKPKLRLASERIAMLKKSADSLEQEVARLRAAPSEANSLLKAYAAALKELGVDWQSGESAGLDDAEHTKLVSFRQSATEIQSLVFTTPITRKIIEQRVELLVNAFAEADKRRKLHDESVRQSGDALQALQSARSLVEKLKDWQKLHAAGIPARSAELATAETALRESIRQLNGVAAEAVEADLAEYANLPLQDAQVLVKTRLEAVLAAVAAAEVDLKRSVDLGQSLSALRHDLHDAAVALLQKNDEWNRCPVCHVLHKPMELQKALDRLIEGDVEKATASLRRNVQVAREQAERERRFATTVASLAKYLNNLPLPGAATCIELQTQLKADLQEQARLIDRAGVLSDERTASVRLGLDWDGWQPKLQGLQRLLPGSDLLSDDGLAAALTQLTHRDVELSSFIDAEAGRRNALNSGMQDFSNVIADPLEGLTLPQRVPVIERELERARQAQRTFDALAGQLALLEKQTVEWVESKISACILAFERAKHALTGDRQAQAISKSKIDEHDKAKASLELTKGERGRLEKACGVLAALTEEASLDQMTVQAFTSIRNKVSSIFARIHTPSEYELGEFSSGGLVVRRDGQAAHQVHQVSTGQRAALALSIFLALNDSADSAPPVVLIDDPVAHVDDLNALSFLDYLRDVALRGKRQIFFATADVRLAALFQRKFEFLGRDHFRKIVLPREPAGGN